MRLSNSPEVRHAAGEDLNPGPFGFKAHILFACSLFWMIPDVFGAHTASFLSSGGLTAALGFLHTEQVWGSSVLIYVDQIPAQSREALNPNAQLFSWDGNQDHWASAWAAQPPHLGKTWAGPWVLLPRRPLSLEPDMLDTGSLFTEETVKVQLVKGRARIQSRGPSAVQLPLRTLIHSSLPLFPQRRAPRGGSPDCGCE